MEDERMKKLQEGRRKYQERRTIELTKQNKLLFETSTKEIGILNEREKFLVGVALYWAEGFKHISESALGLATMNENMATFYISWLLMMGVEKSKIGLKVTVNESFQDEIPKMELYWSQKLGIDISQFLKPFVQKVKQKREYLNSDKYHGVLRIRARGSLVMLRKMRGWINGLSVY